MDTKTKPRKPTVAIIGAGRLGSSLAIALHSSGYPITALVARRLQKAKKAALLLGRSKLVPTVLAARDLAKLPESDLILIATPDDAIAETTKRLARSLAGQSRGTVLHTSGALSSAVLGPLATAGLATGSIHPLVSTSDPVSGAAGLRGAFYCLEGTRKARAVAESIVRDLGGQSFSIKAESKALYHAAAVMASPHLTTLFGLAAEVLAACGLSKRNAQTILLPLLESTVNNLKFATPDKALTGTFARGDVATVRRHLKALSGKEFAEALAVYKLLGLGALHLAEKNGLDPKLVAQITSLLASAGQLRARSMRK